MQVNNAVAADHPLSNDALEKKASTSTANEIVKPIEEASEAGLAKLSELSEANDGPGASASDLFEANAANDENGVEQRRDAETLNAEADATLPTGDTGLTDTRGDAMTYELARDVFDEAVLSFDAYQDEIGEDATQMGYTRLNADQLSAVVGQDVVLDDPESGFNASVYQDNEGNITVSYRGSESGNWNDVKEDWLVSDVGQAFFNVPESYKQAAELASQMKQAFGDDVMLTGHSLGGGMANYAAVDNNLDYNVFNAAGLAGHTIELLGDKVDNYSRTGNVINDEYDPLTNYGGKYNDRTWGNNAQHVGESNLVFLNNERFNWFDTLFNAGKRVDAHMMTATLPGLAQAAGYGDLYA